MFISRHGTCRFSRVTMHTDYHRLVPCHPRLSSCMLDSEAIASAEVNANLEGWQHLVDGQTEVAIEDFSRAIALGQDLPVAYNNRGIAHEVLEQMVEAEADYSEADRLAEKDLELRQRLQSVRVRKPISWKGRKEPAAKTKTEGTDFLISFCNLDHKESNRRLRQLEEGVFFQGQCRCWTENLQILNSCFFQEFSVDDRRKPAPHGFLIFFWWKAVFRSVLQYLFTEPLGNIIHHSI